VAPRIAFRPHPQASVEGRCLGWNAFSVRSSRRTPAPKWCFRVGCTGNGGGPCHLAGRILASLASGETPEIELPAGDPPPVPPEPLAWAGGMVVRAAFLRKERIEAEGRRPDLLTRAVCAAPKALGIHVSR